MTDDRSSHRRILWATSVVGGATLGALAISLLRNKAVALMGGAQAVGLLGLFTSLVATAASLATLGLDSSSVRLVAQNADYPERAWKVRRTAWLIAWPLALVGSAAIWLFRAPLASVMIGDRSLAGAVGWLAPGVAASVVSALQMSIIQAYGRVGDLARVRLWGSLVSTLIALAAIYRFGVAGIVVAVVMVPLANYVLALWFARRLPGGKYKARNHEMLGHARTLITVGAAVMTSQAIGNMSALAGRTIVTRQLGLDAAGFYQASNAIISVNMTLLLNAMTADYYPRISKVADDQNALARTVNQQFHVMMVLAGPALIMISTAAPILLDILYSGVFTNAALLLRLFIVGGLVRLVCWVLGFVVLARGAGVSYLLGELAGGSFAVATWLLVPIFGLNGAGIAAVIGASATALFYVARSRTFGVDLSSANIGHLALVMAMLLAVPLIVQLNLWAGIAFGLAAAGVLALRSLRELRAILSA